MTDPKYESRDRETGDGCTIAGPVIQERGGWGQDRTGGGNVWCISRLVRHLEDIIERNKYNFTAALFCISHYPAFQSCNNMADKFFKFLPFKFATYDYRINPLKYALMMQLWQLS